MSNSKRFLTVPGSYALAILFAAEARSQAIVERITGMYESELGSSVAAAGDFDGDGVGDLLIGAPGDGEISVHSGATLDSLWSAKGGYLFGSAVLGDVDLDGDGQSEVMASRPIVKGVVRIYGGAHGTMLRYVVAPEEDEKFGASLCHGGDIDGDGTPEIVIGAPAMYPTGGSKGRIYYYSYAKDAIVRVLVLVDPAEWGLGLAVANVGDVDGDGKTDLAATYRTLTGIGGGVRIYSGTTGIALRDIPAPEGAVEFGASLAGLGPLTSGGHPRIAIGAPDEDMGTGAVYRYDLVTGEWIDRFVGLPMSEFGHALAASDPATTGGSRVFIVGAPSSKPSLSSPGRVFVYDDVSGTLLHEMQSDAAGDAYGRSVAVLTDLIGDVAPEFAVGAPRWNVWSGAVYLHEGVTPCGVAKNLGGGCVGSFQIQPKLSFDGCLRASAETMLDLEISNGPHFPTFGLLFLGAFDGTLKLNPSCALQFAQLFGSPLVLPITPNGAQFPLSMGSGKFAATATLPATGYAYSFRAQVVIADAGVPQGFSTTNGIELKFDP